MVLVEFREDLRAFSTVSQFNFYLQNLGLIVFTSHRGYGLLLLINMSMLSSISVLPFYGNRYYFSGMLLINFRLYHHTRERPFLVWGDFLAPSRFARSTIPEEKWGLLVVYA